MGFFSVKVYLILDEFILAGELQETSKRVSLFIFLCWHRNQNCLNNTKKGLFVLNLFLKNTIFTHMARKHVCLNRDQILGKFRKKKSI